MHAYLYACKVWWKFWLRGFGVARERILGFCIALRCRHLRAYSWGSMHIREVACIFICQWWICAIMCDCQLEKEAKGEGWPEVLDGKSTMTNSVLDTGWYWKQVQHLCWTFVALWFHLQRSLIEVGGAGRRGYWNYEAGVSVGYTLFTCKLICH